MKKSREKIFILTAILSLFLLFPVYSLAAQQNSDNNTPIHIEADRMESMQNKNAVLFSGKVEAKQGGLIIHSDTMTVYYLSDEEKKHLPPGDTRKMKKLFATGNVEIQNEGWVATGDKVDFFETERKVRLTGNAKVWQDNNLVTGDSVLLYLDEGKSIVERSSEKKGERVKAFFYPGGEKKATGTNKPPVTSNKP